MSTSENIVTAAVIIIGNEILSGRTHAPLIEHPVIAAMIRTRESPPEVMASRLRMARVPEGAALIDNLTGGPPGFFILLTWNCTHIANAAMRPRIESVCRSAGFEPPTICTPEELQPEEKL